MGIYLNPGCSRYLEAVSSNIYVDKTEMIKYTNSVIGTEQKYICVSRPRRFGKTITAAMLCAYYDRNIDSKSIFNERYIYTKCPGYDNSGFINQYDVISVNMQDFLSATGNVTGMLEKLQVEIGWEIEKEFGDISFFNKHSIEPNAARYLLPVKKTIYYNNR